MNALNFGEVIREISRAAIIAGLDAMIFESLALFPDTDCQKKGGKHG